LIGIEDVAAAAGVSISTVSRALNRGDQVAGATRQRVEEAAERLGYVASGVASSLASGRKLNIGVLMPEMDRWFRSSVLAGISATLGRRGYDLTLYTFASSGQHRSEVFRKFLRRQRLDGLITVTVEVSPEESEELSRLQLPTVSVGGSNDDRPPLAVDDVAIARLATEHLIALNHHVIGHIGGRGDLGIMSDVPGDRRRGFEQALGGAGLPLIPSLFEPAEFTIDGGLAAAKQLLGRPGPRPTAIFAACDEIAIGAIIAAHEMGYRVPDDISIIGIDGHDLGEIFGLTTIDQFPREQGELAASQILDAVTSPDVPIPPDASVLPYELVVRRSTRYLANTVPASVNTSE
jgi:LacI family repressor for deo operon, udp, cdd, tsx, nupC, and nupG